MGGDGGGRGGVGRYAHFVGEGKVFVLPDGKSGGGGCCGLVEGVEGEIVRILQGLGESVRVRDREGRDVGVLDGVVLIGRVGADW